MTELHLIYVASIAGAILFFTAGAATIALRRHPRPAAAPAGAATPGVDAERERAHALEQRDVALAEVTRLRTADQVRRDELEQLRRALAAAEQRVVHDERTTTVDRGHAEAELLAMRDRAERAEAEAKVLRDRVVRAEAEIPKLRAREQPLRHELEQTRREVAAAEAAVRASTDAAARTSADAEVRAKRLADELERARTDGMAAARDVEQLQARLADADRLLAERTQSARDLSTEIEQLRGRLRDAEGIRAEYVRLRTAATDAEFLKSEVARLEEELRTLHIDALGGPRPRAARGTARQHGAPAQTIGESLATAIDRFADAGTRSSAVADTLGFPLASSGSDGVALAAYAALLIESASRARQFLPVAAPTAIEVVDEHGARVSVWTFEVEGDRLMLANLAVSPVDGQRVETALADLSAILAPTPLGQGYG